MVIELINSLTAPDFENSQTYRGLTLIPLMRDTGIAGPVSLTLLDEALARGTAEISEVGEAGSVPTLHIQNFDKDPLLILDGEELIGAKQNRVVNTTILVPATSGLAIPVSCVEAGRWHRRTRTFASSGYMQPFKGRARKSASVAASLKVGRTYRSDQQEVWADVDEDLEALKVGSMSRAMNDAYLAVGEDLSSYEQALTLPSNAIGVAMLLNGKVLGVEVFAENRILKKNWHKLVRSYAMEALVHKEPALKIDESHENNGSFETTLRRFFEAIAQSPIEHYPAIGLGEHIRFESEEMTGAALIDRTALIHLYAFTRQGARSPLRRHDA